MRKPYTALQRAERGGGIAVRKDNRRIEIAVFPRRASGARSESDNLYGIRRRR